jgi:hypothetical protein
VIFKYTETVHLYVKSDVWYIQKLFTQHQQTDPDTENDRSAWGQTYYDVIDKSSPHTSSLVSQFITAVILHYISFYWGKILKWTISDLD